MKMKIGKIIVVSGMAGMLYFGMGTAAVAESKGMDHHQMVDYNKDGKVSHEEMMTHCEMSFMKMDKNSDKKLDVKEWDVDWFLDQ